MDCDNVYMALAVKDQCFANMHVLLALIRVLYNAMQVYVLWGTTFLAALLMLALRNIPHRSKAIPKAEEDASAPLLGAHKELPAPCSMVGRPCATRSLQSL